MKKLGYDYHISQGETFTINETYNNVIYPQLTNPRILVTVVSSSFAVNKRVICRKWLPLTPSTEDRDITINCNFTTEDTCWWRSQRYTYIVSIIDGKLTSQWLRELCERYQVQTSDDNKTMYDNLVKAGVTFNKEFDYDAPLTQITYNQPLGYPSTIYVKPSAYVTDTFVKQEQPTPPTPTEMFNLVRRVEHGTVKVYLNGTDVQDGKVLLTGDRLTFEVIPETDYVVTSFKVNGQNFDNSQPYFVTGDTSIVIVCSYNPGTILFNLTRYTENAIVTVMRNEQPVPDGYNLRNGDVITVTAVSSTGLPLQTLTINGRNVSSNITFTVLGDVNIVAIGQSQQQLTAPFLKHESSLLFITTYDDDADILNVYVNGTLRGGINTHTGEFTPI